MMKNTRIVGGLELMMVQDIAELTKLEANHIREMMQTRGEGLPYYQEHEKGPLWLETRLVNATIVAIADGLHRGYKMPELRDRFRSKGANRDSGMMKHVRKHLAVAAWTKEQLANRKMIRKGSRKAKHYEPLPWPGVPEPTLENFDVQDAKKFAKSLTEGDLEAIRAIVREVINEIFPVLGTLK